MDTSDFVIARISERMLTVPGLTGVVLGGSRARGFHSPESDIDVGIYYEADSLNLGALDSAARDLDDAHRVGLLQPPGAWGPWVNGGAWLTVDGIAVDFLLRDISRVQDVMLDTDRGIVTAHYQVGHPHAYISAMYRGELAISMVLYPGSEEFLLLKDRAETYPEALARSLIAMFLFEADFSLAQARKCARRDDLLYFTGHVCRCVYCLNQVLFALNREYCINEKGAVQLIEDFPIHPDAYKESVEDVLANLAPGYPSIRACLNELNSLCGDVRRLAGQ